MKLTFRLFLIFVLCSATWAQKPKLSRDTQGALPLARLQNATSYPGADIGAQVNAAIAALSGSCGEVLIPLGTFAQTTTIVKPRCVRLRGASPISTVLNFTPTSGWAILAADAQGTSIYPEGDASDFTLNGPGAGTAAGGIYFGGDPANVISPSTNYGDHQNFNKIRVFGFGTNVRWGNNSWSDTIAESLIANGGTGMVFPSDITNSGESIGIINTSIQNNNVAGMNLQLGDFYFVSSRCDYNLTCGTVNQAFFYGMHFEQLNGIILTIAGAGPPNVEIFGGKALLTDGVSTDAKMFYVNSALNPAFIMHGTALTAFHAVTNVVNWNGSGANPVLAIDALPYYSTGGFIAALTNATCNFWGCHINDPQNLGTQYEGGSLNIFGGLTVNGVKVLAGAVDPSAGGGVAAPQGSLYLRTNGGASTTLYVKTAAGDTAWTAK